MKKKYHIVADQNMPLVNELFGEFAEITKLAGREILARDLKNADALLCRSITPVNAELLASTPVKFVGTATIGIDHLDTEWLDSNQIKWASAAGCNKAAVAQYVISAICSWLQTATKTNKQLQQLTVGIVGAGNVGTELARYFHILKIKYLLCDPPLQQAGDPREMVTLNAIKQCDVISLHVPITQQGEYPTFHLLDTPFLESLNNQQLVINAARGAVINNQALLAYLQTENAASVILDVFEREPAINSKLARKCLLATPHIAGHTLEGKLRGSFQIYQAFCRHFELPEKFQLETFLPKPNPLNLNQQSEIKSLLSIYNIAQDSQRLLSVPDLQMASQFESMRKDYVASFGAQPRRDYAGWQLLHCNNESLNQLTK